MTAVVVVAAGAAMYLPVAAFLAAHLRDLAHAYLGTSIDTTTHTD